MGIIGLSDPSGTYEAVVFSEGLQQFRDLLEPGRAVLLSLSAEVQGDEVRARIQMVEPLDKATAKLQKGLRVFLRDNAPLESVAKRLEGNGPSARPATDRGDGEVSMVLAARGRRRGGDQTAGPVQGFAADCRCDQGRAGRCGRAGVLNVEPSNFVSLKENRL